MSEITGLISIPIKMMISKIVQVVFFSSFYLVCLIRLKKFNFGKFGKNDDLENCSGSLLLRKLLDMKQTNEIDQNFTHILPCESDICIQCLTIANIWNRTFINNSEDFNFIFRNF